MSLQPIDLAKFTELPDGNLHVKLSRLGSLTVEFPNGQAAQIYVARDKDKAFRAFVTTAARNANVEPTTYSLLVDGKLFEHAEKHTMAFRVASLGRKAAEADGGLDEQPAADSGAAPQEVDVAAATEQI